MVNTVQGFGDRKPYFEAPNILYKFVPPKLTGVLEGRVMRCTPPEDFSDVFDSFHFFDDTDPNELNVIGAPYYTIEIEGFPAISSAAVARSRAKMRAWVKMSANTYPGFSVDAIVPMGPFPDENARRSFREGFKSQFLQDRKLFILCLSEDCQNRVMWDHYAGGSYGYCVGFDSKSEFLSRNGRLRRVIYSENPSRGPSEVAYWRRWTIKHTGYAYEREWRVGYITQETDPLQLEDGRTIRTISFEPDDVKEVILGARASEDTIKWAMSVTPLTASVYKIAPSFTTFNRIRLR